MFPISLFALILSSKHSLQNVCKHDGMVFGSVKTLLQIGHIISSSICCHSESLSNLLTAMCLNITRVRKGLVVGHSNTVSRSREARTNFTNIV